MIYDLSLYNTQESFQEKLYKSYKDEFSYYLTNVSGELDSLSGDKLLACVCKRFNDHKVMSRWMSKLFYYLDQYYTVNDTQMSLKDLAASSFMETYLDGHVPQLCEAATAAINRDRDGMRVERLTVSTALLTLIESSLGRKDLYTTHFQEPFVQVSNEYYQLASSKWIDEFSCPEYLRRVEEALDAEDARVRTCMDSATREPLLSSLTRALLEGVQKRLMDMPNSGMAILLEQNQKTELSRMFRLFHRLDEVVKAANATPVEETVPRGAQRSARDAAARAAAARSKASKEDVGLKPMAAEFQAYVRTAVTAVFNEVENAESDKAVEEYVPRMLERHDVFMDLVKDAFQGNAIFRKCLTICMEDVMNRPVKTVHPAELLSQYCDRLLRKGGRSKDMSDEVIEETMEKIVLLFAYVQDKDMFQEVYRKHLAKRLLGDRSESDDFERNMIAKLKFHYGAAFTSRLEGMVNDKNLSQENQAEFAAHCQENDLDLSISFEVQVLTLGFWPSYQPDHLQLPEVMLRCVERFKLFYDKRTSHRKLSWLHSMGQVVLKAKFKRGPRDLAINTHQAAALLLFNTQTSLTVKEICEMLSLPLDDAKRALVPICAGATKVSIPILVKAEPSKGLSESDVLSVDDKFTSKMRVVRPKTITRLTDKERKNVNDVVQEDRNHCTDAAIVRIMKTHQSVEHRQLIAQVSEQLMSRFQPQPSQIKRRIEDLINREYMERDPDNAGTYKYIA